MIPKPLSMLTGCIQPSTAPMTLLVQDLGGDDTHSAVEILCAELAAGDGLYRPEYRFDDESNDWEHEMYWEQVEQYKPQAKE